VRRESDENTTVIVLVPLDAFEQVGLPRGEKHARRLPKPDLAQARPPDSTAPRVEVRIADRRIEARIVGDARPRRLLALTLGASPVLAGEAPGEDGARAPVAAVAKPMGCDAVASFGLAGPEPAAVHVEFEQGLQLGSLGIDPARFSDVLRPWLPELSIAEDGGFDAMLREKSCVRGERNSSSEQD
jgi:hypothetical protein